jgi:hypothetical protein
MGATMPTKLIDCVILQELGDIKEIVIANRAWLEFLPMLLIISAIGSLVIFGLKLHSMLEK